MAWDIDGHRGWFRPLLPGFKLALVDAGRPISRTNWGTGGKTWCVRWVASLEGNNGKTWTRDDVLGELREILGVRRPPVRAGGALLVQSGIYVRVRDRKTCETDGVQVFAINVECQTLRSFRSGGLRVSKDLVHRFGLGELMVEWQCSGLPQAQARVTP